MNIKKFFKLAFGIARKNAEELKYQAGDWSSETTLSSIDTEALEYWVCDVVGKAMHRTSLSKSECNALDNLAWVMECKWLVRQQTTPAERLAHIRWEREVEADGFD